MRHISKAAAKAIEKILSDGARVELIPTKDGVRVMRVRRDNVFETKENEEQINGNLQIAENMI